MKRRQGFTIVELLVSMALILFIMAILSKAFITAMTAFHNAKAAGDMANKLRVTTQMLQRDLAADHFEAGKRLSDPNFWANGPPQQGFFQVFQGSPSYPLVPLPPPTAYNFIEGSDPTLINSYRSIDHSLAFTIHLRGNDMGDFLSASGGMSALSSLFGPAEARYQISSGGSYNYQWGEVAWFLQPSINPATGAQDTTVVDPEISSAAMPLYTLYRRQRLLVPDNSLVVQPPPLLTPANIPAIPANIANFLEVSCWNNSATGFLYFNSPIDITDPLRRFGSNGVTITSPPSHYPFAVNHANPSMSYTTLSTELTQLASPNPTLNGADIQLTDVISFDVRLLPLYPNGAAPLSTADPFVSLYEPPFVPPLGNPTETHFYNGNTNFNMATGPMAFDTWSSLHDSSINYSQWNVTGQATSIPFWNSTTLTYTYPPPPGAIGPTQTLSLTGSGPIIRAIQVTIRIWDAKANQTRQVTIIQAM